MEVILSHVCSEWRNTAINLSTLWTAFKFDTHLHVPNPAKKLEEYLCRSGTQLLELYFRFSSSDYVNNDDHDFHVSYDSELFARDFVMVETAIAHAYRWHRFTLFADESIPTSDFIDHLRKIYVPNLEYLAICLSTPGYDGSDYGNINPLILTGGAPRLYTVRIDTITPFHSLPPLSNITTLAIQGTPNDAVCFDFQSFYLILTIPTLTNLSLEAWKCLYYNWADNLLRIKMPCLTTLRISQDSDMVAMLTFLNAPLLETVVLHDVDLKSVNTGQDISTFIRLDTIALLDCHYHFGHLDQAGVNRVDMTLNTLACHATHVIVSSHDCPSFIETGSNLLDFNRYRWPRLLRLTLDLPTFSDPRSYMRNFERSPHPITVRVVETVFDQWARQSPGLTTLDEVCTLETMKVGDPMMDEPWPASGGLFPEDGNLENCFIWGETLRARGPEA